jgi:hypothetical protein
MELTIKIDAPDIVEAINNLAHSINNFSATGNCVSELIEKSVEVHNKPTVTLEEVRGHLAELAKTGKQAEVKELLKKYNVSRLTDIPPDRLEEIWEDAKSL